MEEQEKINEKVEQPTTETNKNLPKYKSDGVAVWEFIDKNGNAYLSIKVVGHDYVKAFLNKPKTE